MVRKHVGEFQIIDVLGNKRGELERFRNKKIVEVAVGSGGLYNIVAIIESAQKWNSQHDPNKDYYAILGVHPTAEKAVIDAAYKALAKRYHPDMNQDKPGESKLRMQEINEACEVLSDVSRRKEYDNLKGDDSARGRIFERRR